jgi:hypothetical protein
MQLFRSSTADGFDLRHPQAWRDWVMAGDLLGFLNAMGQSHCAHHVTTIVLLISMYFANRISSRIKVTQECCPVGIRGRARLRDRAYGTWFTNRQNDVSIRWRRFCSNADLRRQ